MILYLGQQKANILHWNLRKEKTLYAAVRERIRETTCSRHSPAHFFPLYILYFNWQPAILVASLNTQTWTQIKRLVEFIAWSSLLRMPSIKIILIFCHIQKRMVHPVYRFVREREMFASQRIAGVCLCMYIYIYMRSNSQTKQENKGLIWWRWWWMYRYISNVDVTSSSFRQRMLFSLFAKVTEETKKKMVVHYETVKAYSLRQWKQNQLGKNKKSPAVLFDYRTKRNWITIFHHNKFNWFIILKHFNKIIRFVHIYLYIDR